MLIFICVFVLCLFIACCSFFFLMIRRPPRSTRTTHSFPTRRSSDLEVMFFSAFFWAFFDASLFPGDAMQVARSEHTGGVWPPVGVEVFDAFHLPFLNTMKIGRAHV